MEAVQEALARFTLPIQDMSLQEVSDQRSYFNQMGDDIRTVRKAAPEASVRPPAPAPPAPAQRLTFGQACRILRQYMPVLDTASGQGGKDGKVSKLDLEAQLNKPDCPPDLKQACQYMLDHPSDWEELQGVSYQGSGLPLNFHDDQFVASDLDEIIRRRPQDTAQPAPKLPPFPAPTVPLPPPMTFGRALTLLQTNFVLVDTAAHQGSPDNKISREDLQAVADGQLGYSQELKQACRFLLDNPAFFNAVDVSTDNGGPLDGLLSKEDVNNSVRLFGKVQEQAAPQNMTLARACVILKPYMPVLDVAGGQGARDGKVSKSDLEAMAEQPNCPPDLRAACRFLLDNPKAWEELDGVSSQGGVWPFTTPGDAFELSDLETTIGRHPEQLG